MPLREVAKLTNELFTVSKQMNSADLIFGNIKMSLSRLKRCSVCLFQEVKTTMEGPPRPSIYRKMDIPIDNHGLSSSNSKFKRSPAAYNTAHSEPILFPNTIIPAILSPPIGVEGVVPIPPSVSHFSSLLQDSSATLSRSDGPCCPDV